MGKFVDLTGQRFGRLVVKERAENDKTHHTRWVCVCDCGNYVTVSQANLSSGNTQSCGCFRKENSQRNGSKSNLHHGQHGTRIYRIWANMLSRCRNPKVRSYKDYGDRGIKVYDEWLIFENFYKWAIQSGYKENLTIDRIDVDGDYSPSNCRWATTKEQARNKRTSRIITYSGNEKVLQDWAHEYSINPSTLRARIESGWNIEDALRKPIK